MGAVTTPDGQTFYAPDGMFPPPAAPPGLDPSLIAGIGQTQSDAPPVSIGGLGGPAAVPSSVIAATPQAPQDYVAGVVDAKGNITPPPSIAQPPVAPHAPGQDYVAGVVDQAGNVTAPPPPAAPAAPGAGGKPAAAPDAFQQGADKSMAALDEKQAAQQREAQEAQAQAQEEADANARANVAEHAANVADAQAIQTRLEGQQAIQDQLGKAVDARANFKLDDNRKWNNLGTGSKILAGISLALSGVGSALQGNGAKNLALETINDAIKQDIESQKFDYEKLGNNITDKQRQLEDYRQQTGDIKDAQKLLQAQRLSEVKSQLDQIARQHQSPIIAARAAQTSAAIDAEKGKLLTEVAGSKFDRDEKLAQRRVAQQNANTSAFSAAEAARHNKVEEQTQRDQMEEALASRKQAADAKSREEQAKEEKEYREKAIGTVPVTEKDSDGNPVIKRKPFVQDDGKTLWIPSGDAGDINKLRAKKTAVDDMTQIMDEVQRLRTGWSNSAHDREEYQQIQAKWNQARVKFKDYAQLGALSESDYALLDSSLGTSDPTKFLDQTAGIKAARSTMVDSLNHDMENHGYTGKRYEPPNTATLTAPRNSETEKLVEDATSRNFGERHGAVLAAAGGGAGTGAATATGNKARMQAFAALTARAQSSDPKVRNDALEYINKIATTDGAPEDVKNAANDYLQRQVGLQ